MAARGFWTNHWVKQSKTKAIQDHFRYLIENFSVMDLDAKYVPAMEFLKASLKIHVTLPSIFYVVSINPVFPYFPPINFRTL